jgi:hypothetical protein
MTRCSRILHVALFAGTVVPCAAAAPRGDMPPLVSPTARVRWMDARARQLLQEGARRSATVSGMLDRIEGSDLIVYVEVRMGTDSISTTRLLVAPPGTRFVLVTIRIGPGFDLIPRLGHELQHVVEIAAARDVRDDEGMRALFKRIGWRSRQPDAWETEAAIDAGRRVDREIRRRPPDAAGVRASAAPASPAGEAVVSGSASPRR